MNRKSLTIVLAVASVLVAASVLWADKAVYDFLHAHYNQRTRPIPPLLRFPTRLLRSLEDWGENVFIACVVFGMWQLDKANRSRTASLVLAALLVAGGVEVVKRTVGRARPDKASGETNIALTQHFDDDRGDDHSFPSGHTAAAGSYSGSLAAFYPPLTPICVALTAGCGASRVWKERHFLSDCIVGGVFGWCVAWSVARSRRLEPFRNWFDERFSVRRSTA